MHRITRATLKDLEQLARLFDQYRMFYQKSSDMPGALKFLSQRLINDDSEIFVSHNETELIGFLQLYPVFSSTRMNKLWLLNDLFIHESFRGQGHSLALVAKAKELCRLSGACGLTLETGKENKAGNSLYLKAGFILSTEFNAYNWAPA